MCILQKPRKPAGAGLRLQFSGLFVVPTTVGTIVLPVLIWSNAMKMMIVCLSSTDVDSESVPDIELPSTLTVNIICQPECGCHWLIADVDLQ